jgi:glycerol-3-phosphate dehydrogenase
VEKVLNTEKSDFYLQKLHPNFPYLRAEVIYAVRFEMAHTIRDFMARRIRLELLDWEASMTVASEIASLMAQELHWTEIQKELYCLNYQELLKEFAKNAGVA